MLKNRTVFYYIFKEKTYNLYYAERIFYIFTIDKQPKNEYNIIVIEFGKKFLYSNFGA